VEKPTKTF